MKLIGKVRSNTTLEGSVHGSIDIVIGPGGMSMIENCCSSLVLHLEYAHQIFEMNIIEREVLHCLAKFAIPLEVFEQSRVGGDASKCSLPEVMMAVDEVTRSLVKVSIALI
jgi:hypothetical protein